MVPVIGDTATNCGTRRQIGGTRRQKIIGDYDRTYPERRRDNDWRRFGDAAGMHGDGDA